MDLGLMRLHLNNKRTDEHASGEYYFEKIKPEGAAQRELGSTENTLAGRRRDQSRRANLISNRLDDSSSQNFRFFDILKQEGDNFLKLTKIYVYYELKEFTHIDPDDINRLARGEFGKDALSSGA
jgi:hypothetical protein